MRIDEIASGTLCWILPVCAAGYPFSSVVDYRYLCGSVPCPQIDQLTHEVSTAKSSSKSGGGGSTDSATIRQKDKELRDLKRQLTEVSHMLDSAKREQRVRDHDLAKFMALQTEISQYKKEKVVLEKKLREDSKKYQEEKRQREQEVARALKRERQMQLELQKKDEQISKQMAALATHRQREKK